MLFRLLCNNRKFPLKPSKISVLHPYNGNLTEPLKLSD
nr:MAG TPA: hypothetical protein [Caudoviricetes sp.]DAO99013.1 MAG TPA: hypothetical protein [Caudoviricetes sp.]DAR97299.1 MAG TPA: hypothetical protein [Caudoviricetes sp.]DAU41066.1 MAG TPA: hypothetical protein [Caudoviricetes sp.]DAX29978.1 MAG TPA: hypothetical protein [Caudoviricetes sp.]